MKIAFYRAKYGNWLDKIIAWWTRPVFWKFWQTGQFSHCEIFFSNGNSFSASPREKCCRWKNIEYEEEHWQFIDIPIIAEPSVYYMCQRENGKPYDYLGIFFTFIVPIDFHEKHKWFCSELVAKLVFNLNHANRYSPNSLYDRISQYYDVKI